MHALGLDLCETGTKKCFIPAGFLLEPFFSRKNEKSSPFPSTVNLSFEANFPEVMLFPNLLFHRSRSLLLQWMSVNLLQEDARDNP